LSIALNAAVKYQHTIGLFSLEMNRNQVAQRLLAMGAGIDQQRLRDGQMEQEEWKRITAAAKMLSEAKIWIDDTADLSTVQLRTRARHFVEAYSVQLIIVDYVHLMQSNVNGKRHENRVQEIGEISRSLKILARDLNIPVLALAQMSRAVESRPSKFPQLSDLRDGSLENDADVVLFLYRDELYQPESEYKNIATIIIAKHRNGPVAELDVHFQPSQTYFRDLALVLSPQSNKDSPL
jgi:replicative DNA helicase